MSSDVDDVSQEVTITLIVAGKPEPSITGIRAPDEAGYGNLIHMEVDLKNVGTGAGKLYAYIRDTETNQIVAAKKYTSSLPINGSQTVSWDLTMPGKDWYLIVWGGHVE